MKGIKRSFQEFKRHPLLHFMSILTLMGALSIVGIFLLFFHNIQILSKKSNPKLMGTAYLIDDLKEPEIQSLRERVLSLNHVKGVEFKHKDSVVRELESFLGSEPLAMPESNLFPNLLEITLDIKTRPDDISDLRSILSQYREIAETDFSEDWVLQYRKFEKVLGTFGIILALIILVSTSFIMANFMGIRHHHRKSEIDILKLIGGNRGYILSPFLWEGLIEGVLGSCSALLLIYSVKVLLTKSTLFQWLSFDTMKWEYLTRPQLLIVVSMGVLMAFLGSLTVFFRIEKTDIR